MFWFVFLAIMGFGVAIVMYLYLKESSGELDYIDRGICPECRSEDMDSKVLKSGGCSGTVEILYFCHTCGYEKSFNRQKGGCGI